MTDPFEIAPPHNKELEEIVLGTLLSNFEAVPLCMPILSEDCFYKYVDIYSAIAQDYEDNGDVDTNRVEHILKSNGHDNVSATIGSLVMNHESVEKAEEYCGILKGLASKRDTRDGMLDLLPKIPQLTPEEIFTNLQNIVHRNVDSISIPGMTYSEIKARDDEKMEAEQLYTGNKFFDHTFFKDEGSRRGGLLVPGGESGHGKTALSVWFIARYLDQGYKGVFCIRESKDSKIVDRVYRNMENKDNIENLIVADVMQGLRNLDDIVNCIKYHNALNSIDFFCADHLRIIPVDGLPDWEENKRITTCVNRLMYLSQEVDAVGITPSQVNRATQSNSRGWDKMPQLFNLYGSSAIEQAASMVISIFRPKEVEELHDYYQNGDLRAVKGPEYDTNGETYDVNSVFIKQIKTRGGERYPKAVRFIHTDNGLKRPTGNNNQQAPF